MLELAFQELIEGGTPVAHGAPDFQRLQIIAFRAIPNRERSRGNAQVFSCRFAVEQRLMNGIHVHVKLLRIVIFKSADKP